MNLPYCQNFSDKDIVRFRKIAEENGIYFTLHLDENADFCNFNRVIKNGWQSVFKETLAAASELKIPLINTHLNRGVRFTLPDRKVFLYEKYLSHYCSSLDELKNICTRYGSNTKVSIENTSGFLPFEKDAIERLISEENIGITWDIGHCESAGGKDEEFIFRNRRKLFHMHIHDASGRKDHLPLGEGKINIHERLEAAKEAGCRCVVEVKTFDALKASVIWLKEKQYIK